MALHIGIGTSKNVNSLQAGVEAAKDALRKLNRPKVNCAILLASPVFNQAEVLKAVRQTVGDAPVVGCSTSGEILSSGPQDQSAIVMVMASDSIQFTPIKIENISKNMGQAGRDFGNKIKSSLNGQGKLTFVFADALAGNATELVRGIFEILGSTYPLMGGAAGDDKHFKKTYQYYNDEVLSGAVVGLTLTGDVRCSIGADHGWQHIGNPRVASKTKGTLIYELDGKPAFDIYKNYFGERADDFTKNQLPSLESTTYPLGMQVKEDDKFMIRAPLAIGQDGSIACGAEVIEGSQIYLMLGTVTSATWAVKGVLEKIKAKLGNSKPKLVFVSSCIARKILMGERTREEIQTIRDTLGKDTEIFGFYSYGQIAPFSDKTVKIQMCDPGFYEQSAAIAVLTD